MAGSSTPDWDARTYDRLAAPQEEWARSTIPRLELAGAETVLDAGCGSGRVTRLLLERLPDGHVVGVDGSPSMLELAAERLEEAKDRLTLIQSDLLELEPADLGDAAPVDAAFSNATFHWIADHPALFARLHAVMAPGARLIAQCGGEGNVADWVSAVNRVSARPEFADHVGGFEPWNFRGPAETEAALRDAGFSQVTCRLEERLVELDDPRAFVATAGLAAHHDRLPEELREPFTDAVAAELPDLEVARYVRLNMEARA